MEDPDDSKLYLFNGSNWDYKTDLSGARGLKGDTGERGLPGKDGKCACDDIQLPSGQVAISSTTGIQSYPVQGGGFAINKDADGSFTIDKTKYDVELLRLEKELETILCIYQ